MANIPATIEEYAYQCERARVKENSFVRGCIITIRQRWRISNMPVADRAHLRRAAVRSFGPAYELVDFDIIRVNGKDYRYNFKTGRFYGVGYVGN